MQRATESQILLERNELERNVIKNLLTISCYAFIKYDKTMELNMSKKSPSDRGSLDAQIHGFPPVDRSAPPPGQGPKPRGTATPDPLGETSSLEQGYRDAPDKAAYIAQNMRLLGQQAAGPWRDSEQAELQAFYDAHKTEPGVHNAFSMAQSTVQKEKGLQPRGTTTPDPFASFDTPPATQGFSEFNDKPSATLDPFAGFDAPSETQGFADFDSPEARASLNPTPPETQGFADFDSPEARASLNPIPPKTVDEKESPPTVAKSTVNQTPLKDFKDRIQGIGPKEAKKEPSTLKKTEQMGKAAGKAMGGAIGDTLTHAFDLVVTPLRPLQMGVNLLRGAVEQARHGNKGNAHVHFQNAKNAGNKMLSGIQTALSPVILAGTAVVSAATRIPGVTNTEIGSKIQKFSDKNFIDSGKRTIALAGVTAIVVTGGGILAPVATAGAVAAATTVGTSLLASSGVVGFGSAAMATATALPSAALATVTALPSAALATATSIASTSFGAAVAVGAIASLAAGAVVTGVVVAGVKSVNYAKTKATNLASSVNSKVNELATSVKQAISSPAKEAPITERTPLLGKGVENSSAEPLQKTSTMQKMFSSQKTKGANTVVSAKPVKTGKREVQ